MPETQVQERPPIQDIRVGYTDYVLDLSGQNVVAEAERSLGITLNEVRTALLYRFQGLAPDDAETIATHLLCQPLAGQEYTLNQPIFEDGQIVQIAYQPGMMIPEAGSMEEALEMLGIQGMQGFDIVREYRFPEGTPQAEIDTVVARSLMNKTVEYKVDEPRDTLVIEGTVGPVNEVPIMDASDDDLMALSKDKLFLNLEEMQQIRTYAKEALGRNLTDVEVEIIAARWSEHCGHKTFKGIVELENGERVDPLYTRIKRSSRRFFEKMGVISAFEDNSGVFVFYNGMAICIKGETHNGPSGMEPFGGAATGVGGVLRDIVGTGEGADLLSCSSIFLFAPLNSPVDKIPAGVLHPQYIQRHVVRGVKSYGNEIGVPDNDHSIHYHPGFLGKPGVIVLADGIIPVEKAQKGVPKIGSKAVLVGGRTGRDGIHGATFSSAEMTDRTAAVNSSAVQIGNPIEEEKMFRAISEARDHGLFEAITDLGAAGISSAFGELAEDTGIKMDLSKVPLKYSGLSPWEIMLSESQERMALSIPADKVEAFNAICAKYGVEASVIGEFDGSNRLTVTYEDEVVADLDYKFLKEGLPQRVMKAHWEPQPEPEVIPDLPTDWNDAVTQVLRHGNVCSKQSIVSQYDHRVKGSSALPPYSGVHFDGPNEAAVLTPLLGEKYGMVKSHSVNPVLGSINPYDATRWVMDRAIAKCVAVGGNPDALVMVDNFLTAKPDAQTMGALNMMVTAMEDGMNEHQAPFISGKDSLSMEYVDAQGQRTKAPPTLCVSVTSKIENVEQTISHDFKHPGSTVVLVGAQDAAMGGSVYYDTKGIRGNQIPLQYAGTSDMMHAMHKAIKSGKVHASHSVGEGGVVTALAHMSFGGDCGVAIQVPESIRPDTFLFNETVTFIVEVDSPEEAALLFEGIPHQVLGNTTAEKELRVKTGDQELFSASVDDLKAAWKAPMQEVFG